ncbi:MAG: hypothetical protein KUL82_03275 [Bdellovibrio sp.]|nr:hypothetical protein [Bdellovibrio sp.]
MRLGTWGHDLSLSFSWRNYFFSLLLLMLTACSDPKIEVGVLNKLAKTKAEFKVNNAIGDGDMLPDATESSIPIEISCSSTVEMMEIQNPQTKEWKKISDLIAGASFSCSSGGPVRFNLPLTHVAPYSAPTTSGDRRQDFQIRWMVKNMYGETSVYYRTLSALFKAPTVGVVASDINLDNAAPGSYGISGSCSQEGAEVAIEGPFSSVIKGICSSGSYSLVASVDTAWADGSTVIKVKHYTVDSYRAYGEATKTILIDRMAPVLSISSPSDGTVFTSSHFTAGSTIQVAGSCSESLLPVKIELNGSFIVETSCSSFGTFHAEVIPPEGPFTIKASHSDGAGNNTNTSLLSLEKDTTPPGAFSISGVRSNSGTDVTADSVLTDLGLRVDLSTAAGAASYDVVVKDSAGASVICPLQAGAVTQFSFDGCVLNQSGTYKVFAQAKDSHGNVIAASNNGFSFTVQYPVPEIVKVYGSVPNTTQMQGATIYIYVEYNRAVSVLGAPKLALNTSAEASFVMMADADKKTLKFQYMVGANQYAGMLGVEGAGISLNGGSINDIANSAVNASLAVPVDDGVNANWLKSNRIKVDSQPPGFVTGLTLNQVSTYYFRTPMIHFELPAGEPEPVTVFARVRTSSNSELQGWTAVVSDQRLDLVTHMMPGTTYYVDLRAQDPAGNIGSVVTSSFVSFLCPTGFVYIYNPAMPAVAPFCVGQFEAKLGAGNLPSFVAAGYPWALGRNDAMTKCQSLGGNYDLISNTEWNTVAELIAQQGVNWTGDGILFRGNNNLNPPREVNTAAPFYPNLMVDLSQIRSHSLPYNQTLWDFSGNATEVVKDLDAVVYSPYDGYVAQLALGTTPLKEKYGTSRICASFGVSPYCGLGYINVQYSGTIWRGGSCIDADGAGVFATWRNYTTGANDPATMPPPYGYTNDGGFRCVYHP